MQRGGDQIKGKGSSIHQEMEGRSKQEQWRGPISWKSGWQILDMTQRVDLSVMCEGKTKSLRKWIEHQMLMNLPHYQKRKPQEQRVILKQKNGVTILLNAE